MRKSREVELTRLDAWLRTQREFLVMDHFGLILLIVLAAILVAVLVAWRELGRFPWPDRARRQGPMTADTRRLHHE
jgi:hypothetical protein